MAPPRLQLAGTVLSTRDAGALAAFYQRLLGLPKRYEEDGWVILRADDSYQALSFHHDAEYTPPVWPSRAGEQLMMVHLDIATDDLAGAVAHAVECGATVAEYQPQADVTVMLDPDGHPFCLFAAEILRE